MAAATRPKFTTLSYETHRFVQSYEKVHIVCGVLSALGILNACTSGFTKTGLGAPCRAFHHLMVLFVRRWLQRMEDKDYACKLFSWIMSLFSIALVGGLAAAQRSDPFVSGLKARAAWMTAAMGGLSMLALQRKVLHVWVDAMATHLPHAFADGSLLTTGAGAAAAPAKCTAMLPQR